MKDDMNGKVFLEANINGYFYMYNHLGLLPANSTLILIDKYPEILRMYKALIEQCDIKCQILYIADAGTDYPLKAVVWTATLRSAGKANICCTIKTVI